MAAYCEIIMGTNKTRKTPPYWDTLVDFIRSELLSFGSRL